jgi:hypothetical protein
MTTAAVLLAAAVMVAAPVGTSSAAERNCDQLAPFSGTDQDAQPSIQQCIDEAASGDTLFLPTGLYSLESGLTISQSISLLSNASLAATECDLGDLYSCTMLQASATFYSQNGLVHIVPGASNVALDRLVIDGNRDARMDSQSAVECAGNIDNRNAGRSAVADGCSNCSLTNSVVANALCASGFIWVGDSCTITGNKVVNNGDHFTSQMWADGITCLGCDRTEISNNYFAENTDIDLILGSGVEAHVHDNSFAHSSATNRPAFGALMLDNFVGSTSGDFAGASVENNNIDCDTGMCCFGIELGPHPWYASVPITGGFTVSNNAIRGAGVGVNVDAGGSTLQPIALQGNAVSNTVAAFTCGALRGLEQPGSDINVSPDSVVAASEDNQATSATTYACQ